MPHLPASDALSHIKVIDLTRVRSGPTAVRQLADWGADVIKVEAPESVEPDGALGASRHTSDFQNLHRNKRSITLNLKKSEAIEILMKLVEKSDVVVENFRPDVKQRLGIDYEILKKRNPRIILASAMQRISSSRLGSLAFSIFVRGFERKFWIMTSWM